MKNNTNKILMKGSLESDFWENRLTSQKDINLEQCQPASRHCII